MNEIAIVVLAAAGVAAVLWLRRSRAESRMRDLVTRRGSEAMLSSRAQLVDGANHIPVALMLDAQRITYLNEDVDASIDIRQIDEVEYASDLVTGGIAHGVVLRLRAHGRAIEFVLESTAAERWSHRLPPHRVNEAGGVHAM